VKEENGKGWSHLPNKSKVNRQKRCRRPEFWANEGRRDFLSEGEKQRFLEAKAKKKTIKKNIHP